MFTATTTTQTSRERDFLNVYVTQLVDEILEKCEEVLQDDSKINEPKVSVERISNGLKHQDFILDNEKKDTLIGSDKDEEAQKSVFTIPSINLTESRKVLGVEFAPVSIPFERRLQTFAVMQWWFSVIFFPILGIFAVVYLLFFTRFWFVIVFYISWVMLYDRKTPKTGGRRSRTVRRLKLWTYYRDYFPISLRKTEELNPSENYIIGYHPHGIISCGAFCNFGTEATGFSKLFPGIKVSPLTLNVQFFWPFFRDYLMSLGLCDVSRESINWLTTKNGKGNAVVIVIGGAEEALEARPNNYRLKLKNRKGFCKMALQTGSHLVPCYSFGENELFKQADNPKGSKIRQFQEGFKNIFGFSPPLVYGRGVFNYSFGFMPFRKPITTVVGKPIIVIKNKNPSTEDVDTLHDCYISALSALFNDHKEEHDIGKEAVLEII